jgi:hypothetical protein
MATSSQGGAQIESATCLVRLASGDWLASLCSLVQVVGV